MNEILNNPLFLDTAPGKSLKKKPLGFIDIGARGGVHPLVEPLAGATAVLAFEPDEEESKRMQEELAHNSPYARFKIMAKALAGKEGKATLYMYNYPTNDSLLPANQELLKRYKFATFEDEHTTTLSTVTLDQVLFGEADMDEMYGEFMKLDTQGTELDILSGARRTLAERSVALVVEVIFTPMYKNQHLFSEMEMFLRKEGFSFYGFTSMHHRSLRQFNKQYEASQERTIWADALFFKDPIPSGTMPIVLSDRGIYALFVCALLTGYYDFALELADKTWVDGEERNRIHKLVHTLGEMPVSKVVADVQQLTKSVTQNPQNANIEVGRFIDDRRHYPDYDDIPRK